MHLGFVVKPLARPELRSHDSRRWQNGPHLSVSLAHLRDVIGYLVAARIGMYRMSSDLAPYATHPDLPQFHRQVDECERELAEVGRLASEHQLRLSFHPSQHVVLSSPDEDLVYRSSLDLIVQASILDRMGLGPECVVVTHLGGVYGDISSARSRFAWAFESLPEHARRRLVVENDDTRFGVQDVLWIHERVGVPVVFDNLHHNLHNPSGLPAPEALSLCLATWSADVTPKVHFSSPRTEWLVEKDAETPAVRRARWSYHADYVHPFEFIAFLRAASGVRPFDVMLEVRAKDIALQQLRTDLARFAADLSDLLEPPPA